MRENSVKTKWQQGVVTYGAWLTIPSPFCAEVFAHQGYDWLCIDMQHGVIDYWQAVEMLQAISTTDVVPFVRVPWNEPGIIGKVLDAGVMGVIIPMVNTSDQARAAVSASKYYPLGSRSFGPIRAGYYAGADYFSRANEDVICMPMIETREAVENLEEILSVPGVDAVYVGPSDLRVSMGLLPGPGEEPEFEEARLKIPRLCAEQGVLAGIHANAQLAAKHIAAGYQFITITSDVFAIAASAARDLQQARGTGGELKGPLYR